MSATPSQSTGANMRDTPLGVAILVNGDVVAEQVRSAFVRERCDPVRVLKTPEDVKQSFADKSCNALVVDLSALGADRGIELIETLRKQHSAAPICVFDNYAQVLRADAPNWVLRLSHYYCLPVTDDVELLRDCISLTARQFRFYLRSTPADHQQRGLREYLATLSPTLGVRERNRIIGLFLDAAEALVATEQQRAAQRHAGAGGPKLQAASDSARATSPYAVGTIAWLRHEVPMPLLVEVLVLAVLALYLFFELGRVSAGASTIAAVCAKFDIIFCS